MKIFSYIKFSEYYLKKNIINLIKLLNFNISVDSFKYFATY